MTATPGSGPYHADIRSYNHPYPFGMPQPGRSWDSVLYRYGFNGMETDPEIKEGRDQHYTTFFRQYDPRLGRWWSHDPVKQMGESPYAAMFNNPVLFGDALGSDPESSPLEPGGGGGGGGGRNAHRGGGKPSLLPNWVEKMLDEGKKKIAKDAGKRAGKAGSPQPSGTAAGNPTPEDDDAFPTGFSILAHTSWFVNGDVEEVQPALADLGDKTYTFGYNVVDGLSIGGQVFLHMAVDRSQGQLYVSPDIFFTRPVYRLDGKLATPTERILGLVDVGLLAFGGPAAKVAKTVVTKAISGVVGRLFGPTFRSASSTAVEVTVAAEARPAVATGLQLLDDGAKLLPEASAPELGGGTLFQHFTDAEGISGITGIEGTSLSVGQEVTVAELRFGIGTNTFLVKEPGDIFLTDLGVGATSGQLGRIGVFENTGKQGYAILMSQETLLNNGIRTSSIEYNRYTIPGGKIIQGLFQIKRVR